MGLAFWRVYHEQQQQKIEEAIKVGALKELSPLHALQAVPEPPSIKAEGEPAPEADKESDKPLEPPSGSHSRIARTRKLQAD